MKSLILIAVAGFAAGLCPPGPSGDPNHYRDENGREWHGIRLDDGLLLQTHGTNMLLRSDCRAESPAFGEGRWEWANGGFVVIFDGDYRIGFPRQEIDAGQGERCRA